MHTLQLRCVVFKRTLDLSRGDQGLTCALLDIVNLGQAVEPLQVQKRVCMCVCVLSVGCPFSVGCLINTHLPSMCCVWLGK